MCGLHGVLTKNREINADDFISNSFVANQLRGVDSSGVASIDITKNMYETHKLPVCGQYFISDAVAKRIIREAGDPSTLTMCHVRAATVGNISLSNAHPFVTDPTEDGRIVIGMHNGTLTGWSSKKNGKYYTVDSEWAINHIAEEGFDAFEDFRGAFCFVWWDSDKKDTLNIARNAERPMYVAMLESGGLAYASEPGMLYWLLERNRIKMKGDILELEAGYWYKFAVDNVEEFSKVKLPSDAPPVRQYTPPTTQSTTVDKVNALLKRASAAANDTDVPAATNVRLARHHLVSISEHERARNLGLLGEKAAFEPISEWAEGIEGIASVGNMEVTAVVRGYDARFRSDEVWTCCVVGVRDDGEEMSLLLAVPTMKERKATVH